jgi:hypothetical protein
MLWGLDISEILGTSLLERSTIYDPAFATGYVRQDRVEKCVESLLV